MIAIIGGVIMTIAGVWLFLGYLSGVRSERELRALYQEMPPSAAQALENPGQITLFSLEPWAVSDKNTGARDHKVLGQVTLDQTRGMKAIAAFRDAVASVQCSGWFLRECHAPPIAFCFNPRHALDVTANGKKFHFLLCYECSQMQIFEDGRPLARLAVAGSPKVLNALLAAANVPLPKSAP